MSYDPEYYQRNKATINAKARAKYAQNPEPILAKQRARDKEFRKTATPRPPRKSAALRQAEYRARHPAKVKAAMAEYRVKNIGKVRAWRRDHHHKGMKNPEFVVVKRLRSRLNDEIRFRGRKTRKIESVTNLIGCARADLVRHIESLFKPGMSWSNRSAWHIDHIRPVSSFDMMDLEEQKKCFHYSNLQPLWVHENCSKHAKFISIAA